MTIKGFLKTSFVDWDGKITTVLFCAGCNFRCPFCFNSDLVLDNPKIPKISEQEIFEFLDSRKNFIDGVCITGGEPTLQQDLPEFLIKIKNLKFKIKLDTNGSNPEMLEDLIKNKLIDYVAMDIKGPLNKYKKISQLPTLNSKLIKESIDLIINSGVDHEFRSTLVPGIHTKEDIKKMAQLIKGGKKYYLQNFKPEKTLDPKLKNTKPFASLENFAKIANKYMNTRIRA